MPQLDISTYSSQIFWLIVCFSLLLWSSGRHLLPRMQKLLGERWSLIDGRLEEAKALQEEAYMLSQELQKELEFSKDRAHDQILATSRQLSIDLNKKRLELSKVSKEKFRAAELRTFEKKSSAMGHVQEIALDLTDYIGSLLLSEPISSSTVQKTVSSYLSHGSDHEL